MEESKKEKREKIEEAASSIRFFYEVKWGKITDEAPFVQRSKPYLHKLEALKYMLEVFYQNYKPNNPHERVEGRIFWYDLSAGENSSPIEIFNTTDSI